MRKYCILCILLFHVICMSGKKNITGIYVNESGMKIEIRENMLYYIMPQNHLPTWSNDTLARCSYSFVDDSFINIKSVQDPNFAVLNGIDVIQLSDTTIKDSMRVSIVIPYNKDRLRISVYTEHKVIETFYSKDNKDIILPKGTKNLSFSIRPEYVIPHTAEGKFYGVVDLSYFPEYAIEKDTNSIVVEIPALDERIFEQYYIVSDYVKVSNSYILWQGETFKKQ